MKITWVMVMAWWFFWSGWHSEQIVGPFHTQVECENTRKEAVKNQVLGGGTVFIQTSPWCWWDGNK